MSSSAITTLQENVGQIFMNVLHAALVEEEQELRAIQAQNPHLWLKSVSFYYERWMQYLAVKQAARLGLQCPRLWVENDLQDASFVDESECEFASFELKGPLKIENGGVTPPTRRAILKDFEKQLQRASQRPDVRHFVILLLFGRPGVPARWIQDVLSLHLKHENPASAYTWTINADRINLNRRDGCTEMIISAAEVFPG
jgi:hypothetical protein